MSRTVQVEEQRQVFLDRMLGLSRYSVLDELQVLQLGEHEIPVKGTDVSASQLSNFPSQLGDSAHWSDLLRRLKRRVQLGPDCIVAVPYFQNISLLAHVVAIDEEHSKCWHSLAAACNRFEAKQESGLFFDFVKDTDENYNSLYFEMLLSLSGRPNGSDDSALLDWLHSREAIEALVLFWGLCHSAHSLRPSNAGEESGQMQVDHGAQVWRHWNSTLNQMLADMMPAARSEIRVRALPQEISSAGEWFLAVPAHSAAPELAIAMIHDVTRPQAELERVREGVGLPTRTSYYDFEGADEHLSTPVSSYFSMKIGSLRKLVTNAFPRSSLSCYSQFSPILASHLLRLLEAKSFQDRDARDVCRSLELRVQKIMASAQPRSGTMPQDGEMYPSTAR